MTSPPPAASEQQQAYGGNRQPVLFLAQRRQETGEFIHEPAKYGKPLRGTLAGYWKLRVGDWRVVYAIYGKEVVVFAIKHRNRVYDEVSERL
jgi:mRNA-degrading endonuclease RelE of RelBE toxin-antitoxin system